MLQRLTLATGAVTSSQGKGNLMITERVMELSADSKAAPSNLEAEHRELCDRFSKLNSRFRKLLERPEDLKEQFEPLWKQYEALVQDFHALNTKYRDVESMPSDEREHAYAQCSHEQDALLEQYYALIKG